MYSQLILLVTCLCGVVFGDTPANCTHADLIGKWNFYMFEGGHDKTIDCTNPGQVKLVLNMIFSGMNTITKGDGQLGTFDLIYNQGFEVTVGYRKYFSFFDWKQIDANHSKYWCDHTANGWSHDVLGNDWACFTAVKQKEIQAGQMLDFTALRGEVSVDPRQSLENKVMLQKKFHVDKGFIHNLNQRQNSWVAGYYPELTNMTYEQVLMRSGYGNGRIVRSKLPMKLRFTNIALRSRLPASFDWRNVGGINYVSPIRNQGTCGSCYAFASMAMLEARIRIMTNNSQTPVFSPQEIVSCSKYAQGCAGGFPYLIAGKYAQDYGVVEESCYPYLGKDTPDCTSTTSCQRTFAAKYGYVGGYYGACTEEKMMEDLVANGPIAVGIEVYQDFQLYKGGIYHHVKSVKSPLSGDFNPFELTNHAVLVVGFGADSKTGEKYWIVKNSWGENWGEKGFVRIKRGTDEIAIESLALESFPIPQL